MKKVSLLSACFLATMAAFPSLSLAAGPNGSTITASTVTAAQTPVDDKSLLVSTTAQQDAAQSFIEHINYARVALAMNNRPLAKQHIAQAQQLYTSLKNAASGYDPSTRIESGRVSYDYDQENRYHYFPISAGPIELKSLKEGPVWAKKGLAVTDAEIVYLTLDLGAPDTEKHLTLASAAIDNNNVKDAQAQLAKLTDEVVDTEEAVAVPLEKARDNIALARNFTAMQNYDGARFALKHADNALDQMEQDQAYAGQRARITAMRSEVATLQDNIAGNDPTMLQKADASLDKWWNDLKDWASNKMPKGNISPASGRQ